MCRQDPATTKDVSSLYIVGQSKKQNSKAKSDQPERVISYTMPPGRRAGVIMLDSLPDPHSFINCRRSLKGNNRESYYNFNMFVDVLQKHI